MEELRGGWHFFFLNSPYCDFTLQSVSFKRCMNKFIFYYHQKNKGRKMETMSDNNTTLYENIFLSHSLKEVTTWDWKTCYCKDFLYCDIILL